MDKPEIAKVTDRVQTGPGKSTEAEKLLGQLIDTDTQIRKDAEAREKPILVKYSATWGASLRTFLRLEQKKLATFLALGLLAVIIASNSGLALHFTAGNLPVICALAMWMLCLVAMFLLPQDSIYIDRLVCIIPGRNPLLLPRKLLWSKLDEIALADVSSNGKQGKFSLRLIESSGNEHEVNFALLDRESLKTFAHYIRTYAPLARGLEQLKELERFYDYQMGTLAMSYTQLWESSGPAQFGLTCFTPLEAGARVQDCFTVLKQIAAGGFSAIYLIQDTDGSHYVLKESVLPSTLDEALRLKAAEQFQREANLLSKLSHPQIARVLDYFVENGRNYLRMEYIDGPNLRNYVGNKGPQPEAVVAQWSEQLAAILGYLQELTPQVVHRDLSPDNIVIRQDGRPVLIDFGAANEFIGQATGTLVGKHAYMAPEQIRGSAEPASDLYSLGACAFFCLTGRDPEPIRTSSPRDADCQVSEWFDRFVRQCTKLDREERFGSARECLSYLRNPNGMKQ